MVEYQWNIFWVYLELGKGSEQSGKRPVLVISAEEVNQYLPVVGIISLTSYKAGREIYPTEAYLGASETGLAKDSIAMAHQVRVISKDRLEDVCGNVSSVILREKIRSVVRKYLDV
ncbi:MAG: type II toxin-antitoxin system PemK/MazF family toxin [Actinobacteria bacterium]|nr:type II toxin-antitoxin system PemK/MazF family toxin [Actinomycetota bacterium]